MNIINLAKKEEIIQSEFCEFGLSKSNEDIFDFCYSICSELVEYINKKISNGIRKTDIDEFYFNNRNKCSKYDIDSLVYFDAVIFRSGLDYMKNPRDREICFNYLYSFHASLRRGKPAHIETITFWKNRFD